MLEGRKLWGKDQEDALQQISYKNQNIYSYKGMDQNIYINLVNSARRYGKKTAIVTDSGNRITYDKFLEEVDITAAYLKYEKKILPGDRVVLMLYNTLEFCVLVYAAAKVGGVIVPISTKYKLYEWHALFQKFSFTLLFLDQRLRQYEEILRKEYPCVEIEVLREGDLQKRTEGSLDRNHIVEAKAGWEDDVIMMFTSGTTSESKGVILTNLNIMNAIYSYEKILNVKETDKTLIATPIYHIIGIVSLLGVFIHCGGTVYLHMNFRPERVLKTIGGENITFMHTTLTVFAMLLDYCDEYPELPSWKTSLCGSANTPPSMIEKLHGWLPQMEFHPVYGLTESSSAGAIFPGGAAGSAQIGTSGKIVPGICAKIIRGDGTECEPLEAGELLLKGCFMMDRYWGESCRPVSGDGWIPTGDIAILEPEGFLRLIDRKKDMISRGGEKIWSNEVENIIYKMNQVASAALIGVPDPKYGEIAVAVVKPRDTLTEDEVKAWVGEHLAKYKIPSKVLFMDELPRTQNGKISKKMLREQYKKQYSIERTIEEKE